MARRKENAIKNILWGTINKVVSIFTPFITRTIMIHTLGAECLGLNSLFVSILQVLNITELGISSAITYNMYKPIAEHDTERINSLLFFFKRIYKWIGLTVLLLGLAVTPFFNIMIKNNIQNGYNIYILYILYLLNSTISYWLFAYKKSLIEAFQRSDLISNTGSVILILQLILQSIALVALKNYYLYVGVMILSTIASSIMYESLSKKYFPECHPYGLIDKETTQRIKKNTQGLLVSKLCAMTRNSLDSIFISAFLGLTVVAIYNNYYLIMNAVITFIAVLSDSILAGVGDSVATETVRKNYDDMNKINFIYMWVAGWTAICLLCLFQPFMQIWMGDSMMLPFSSVILFCIYYYCLKMGDVRGLYIVATGSWEYDKKRAILETICNISLNLILGILWGVNGIIVATAISLFAINFIYGSSIIFKQYFKEKTNDYFKTHFKYILSTTAVGITTYILCSLIHLSGLNGFILKLILCLTVPNLCFMILYRKNSYLLEVRKNIKAIFRKKHNKVF